MHRTRRHRSTFVGLGLLLFVTTMPLAHAQEETPPAASPAAGKEQLPPAKAVSVEPQARDEEISRRLEKILEATGWYEDPRVRVDEGVVFLHGVARDPTHLSWASQLATSTQDVVAVVNKMEIAKPRMLDLRPAFQGLVELWSEMLRLSPYILFGILILLVTLLAARWTNRLSRRLFLRRLEVPLLRDVIARGFALLVFLIGLYIVLRVSGLSRLALSVLGGTGLIGLIIGIAFRDIAENFLASILLSVQRPFRNGDLVQIDDVIGTVERLTVRTTILMTPEGNHLQIPNATVYKAVIRNFTSNPNRRDDFVVGISYDAPITEAQNIALKVLADHPAVLRDPEPWVLVDQLGAATVDLRIYFWLDGVEHSQPKVRSSVIRLIKSAFEEAGIGIPDTAREIVFPSGVPIHMTERNGRHELNAKPVGKERNRDGDARRRPPAEPVVTRAEGGLGSEAGEIEEQSRHARSPEPGVDLLPKQPATSDKPE